MPLTLNCPKCKTPFKVRDEALGQKVKCPTCGAILAVPANIGPASITDIPIDPKAMGRPSSPGLGMGPPPVPPRPIPESVRFNPNDDPETLGLEQNPEDLAKQLASQPSTGRQSRVEPTKMQNDLPPPTPNRPQLKPLAQRKKGQPVPVGEESEQYRGWRSVAGRLRLIQVAMWILFLPGLCEVGKLGYFHFGKVDPAAGKGFLGFGTLWQEITLIYMVVPTLLGLLLILMGRIGLRRVPISSEARGLATGGMLFELVVFLGVSGGIVMIYLISTGTLTDRDLIEKVSTILPATILFFMLLSELWFLYFLCQIGFPIGEPSMTKRVANFMFIFLVLVVGVGIASETAPIFGRGRFATREELEQNLLYSYAGAVFLGFVIFFMYTRLCGKARKAIWRLIQDREPVMVMVR
jgi:predicted Zn finger-like uncharacterized protein